MTDASTSTIARQCLRLREAPPPAHVLEEAGTRVLDTLGCLLGGADSPPARVARRLARHQGGGAPAGRVIGTDLVTTVEAAAFANGVMARYLDYNDTFPGPGTGHPSDLVPALLTLADAEHRTGAELLTAVVTGYETFGVIAKQISVRARGWDQGVMIGLAASTGAAALLGLDQTATEHALGLAATMAMPTRSTRAGALSMWKGCATSAAARFGLFAAQLAADGMTAPDRAIEGKDGLWQQVTGEFEVGPFGDPDPWVVSSTAIKYYPVEYHAQIPLELVGRLRERVAPEEVARVEVDTYWHAFDEIGNEPEKWNPRTRETADHSLPYLVAVMLREGGVSQASFDVDHLADPAIREVLGKVSVSEDPDFTRAWPQRLPCRVTLVTQHGQRHQEQADFPLGHPRRPLPAAEVGRKFLAMGEPVLGERRAREALTLVGELGSLADVAELITALEPVGDAPGSQGG